MPRRTKGKIKIEMGDIVGRKYGRLEVVEYAGHWYDMTAGGQRMRHKYTVVCECGAVKQLQRGQLLSGHTLSCGCIKSKARGNSHGN